MNGRYQDFITGVCFTVATLLASGNQLFAQGTGYAWLEFGTREAIVVRAGDAVPFDVVIRDARGDTIRNWDAVGQPIELHVIGSDAEMDTSDASWNARPDAYTWLRITNDGNDLVPLAPQRFLVNASEFVEGVVHLAFISSKAESGTRIEAAPFVDSLISRSPPITRLPLDVDHFLVAWTPQGIGDNASTFFLARPVELIITPRDRYTNPVTDSVDVTILVNFQNEFSPVPGHGFPPLAAPRRISGEQVFAFQPDTTRLRGQSAGYVITAYVPKKFGTAGKCDSFFVASHPPLPFSLLSPDDGTVVRIDRWDDLIRFRWERPAPPDPYADIRISRDDPRTYSDTVRYRIHFADADSLANEVVRETDAGGTAPSFTCTMEILAAIADTLSGISDVSPFDIVYFVEATDGVHTTWSTPIDGARPGNRITVGNFLARTGVALEFTGTEPLHRVAGEAVDFLLVARDSNDAVVPDWNVIGRSTVLRVPHSEADRDTSTRAWADDPDGYSWARLEVAGTLIPPSAPGEYHIPKTLFVDGRASVSYASSKAEDGVRLEVHPTNPRLQQTSPPIRWSPAAFDNILVDITWPYPERRAVYVERPFELYIAARDRFLNPLEEETTLRLDLRFPGEVVLAGDSARRPLEALLRVSGDTAMLLLPTAVRGDSTGQTETQWLGVHAPADPTLRDDVGLFAVLEHAPLPFRLFLPPDYMEYRLQSWYSEEIFSWERPAPPDPRTDIAVSRYPGERQSDTLRYTIRMHREHKTSDTLAFFADDDGRAPRRMFTSTELHAIYQHFAVQDTSGEVDLLWYVDATDGLFTTRSTPVDSLHPGYRLRLTLLKPPVVTSMFFPLAENTTGRFTIDNGEDFRGGDMRLRVTGSVDTLGYEWWEVGTSGAQTPIPALYRNEYDGLHVARESGGRLVDRLWLPARCAVGDIFPMGRVLATDNLTFGDVTRETVTIDYGAYGTWTYADSVGLLSIEQDGKVFRLAEIGTWLHPLEPKRAQEQAVPFAPDDLLVYRMAGGRTPEWEFNIFRSNEAGKRAWVRNQGGTRSYLVFEWIIDVQDGLLGVSFRVNDRGMLAEYDGYLQDSVELFPAFIPTESTVLLNNVAWSVGRRFDTIVLGAQCRAFELRRGQYYRVITDRFGEVFCTSTSQLCLLSSGVVRDTAYNRDTPAVNWFDLCVGNRYQFSFIDNWRRVMRWTEITADTLVHGQRWYQFSGEGPLLGWFRSDSSGFLRRDMSTGGVELLFTGRLNIGDLCRWGMVLDTASVSVDGEMRRRVDSYEHGYGYTTGRHARLLEGIGMLALEMYAWERTEVYQLTYAEVCGLPWGSITGIVGSAEAIPESPTLSVAPQPLHAQGTVHFNLSRPARVRISVFDLFGRERIVVGEGEFPAGSSTVALSATGLVPGVYLMRLQCNTGSVTSRFMVLQ
ncbi:MAG: T9SS type A sorting domain-containing protein [Bacteroidota bacterium]|jgi:hypothetical protein|nr:T9SS type A sorting domain-containing protein [Bacteroidota bacterium]